MYRIELLEGRRHIVTPVVMLRAQVLNGSNGPLFYPEMEIENSTARWNGVPCVINHPGFYTMGDAGDPSVFNQQKVGHVFNSKYGSGVLRAEAWLDEKRLHELAPDVRRAVLSGERVEVSTGLYSDNDWNAGVHSGVGYHAIARNFRPNHLAILPTDKGACAVEHGCGLGVTNQQQVQTQSIPMIYV